MNVSLERNDEVLWFLILYDCCHMFAAAPWRLCDFDHPGLGHLRRSWFESKFQLLFEVPRREAAPHNTSFRINRDAAVNISSWSMIIRIRQVFNKILSIVEVSGGAFRAFVLSPFNSVGSSSFRYILEQILCSIKPL